MLQQMSGFERTHLRRSFDIRAAADDRIVVLASSFRVMLQQRARLEIHTRSVQLLGLLQQAETVATTAVWI
jgi:hypothetical protein